MSSEEEASHSWSANGVTSCLKVRMQNIRVLPPGQEFLSQILCNSIRPPLICEKNATGFYSDHRRKSASTLPVGQYLKHLREGKGFMCNLGPSKRAFVQVHPCVRHPGSWASGEIDDVTTAKKRNSRNKISRGWVTL